MGKKKFIDKKKAVTFRLVNRSQQDPLYVDETAPQHVLVPVSAPGKGGDPRGFASALRPSSSAGQMDAEKRKKEQAKFGVYFDDDYDYLQHLREPGRNEVYWEPVEPTKTAGAEKVSIKLPSSVFASEVEEAEGLMKKKAQQRPGPRPDWDPDVVAALDEDFNFDDPSNELEDNFMELAMGGEGDVEEGDDDFFDEEDEDGEYSDVDSNDAAMSDEDGEERDGLGPLAFDREETKSRFTEYSMSSSVIRRNEQLTLLDDRFEKFYEQYDDPELGALDCEDIEGHVEINDSVLLQYAEEYRKERDEKYEVDYNKQWDKERILKLQEVSSDEEEMVELEVEDETQKKWDCESILSSYSNCYNHPKLIEEPKKRKSAAKISIHPKTGLPMNTLGADSGKLTMKSLARHEQDASAPKPGGPKSLCDGTVISTLSVLSIRPKDETSDEKRERKKLLKEYRAERRIERKANTEAFKEEKKQQEKIQINKRATAGVRIV
ncbi:protein LTV1 homolog [Aedes albopictus]|uniref:Protein LTV1 homolog n=1 Tax=Aedes albopictus TaxID=7160 RepID=A0ABM1Y3N4_AEDAL|nr:protein LTV1 homolog [Aedes albopictus]